MTGKKILLLVVLCLHLKDLNGFIREKRNLIFTPRNNIIQLILGTGVPVPLEEGQALTVGYVFKATYGTPNNASYFTNPYVTLQKRSIENEQASRFDIYRSVEAAYEIFGGKGCVLRAICETAQTPFKRSSILSQVLHIIFTPSSTDETADVPGDLQYEGAARLGAQGESCVHLYPECKSSLLDVLSVTQ